MLQYWPLGGARFPLKLCRMESGGTRPYATFCNNKCEGNLHLHLGCISKGHRNKLTELNICSDDKMLTTWFTSWTQNSEHTEECPPITRPGDDYGASSAVHSSVSLQIISEMCFLLVDGHFLPELLAWFPPPQRFIHSSCPAGTSWGLEAWPARRICSILVWTSVSIFVKHFIRPCISAIWTLICR